MCNVDPSFHVVAQSTEYAFIGKTMEPGAAYPLMPEATYDWQPLGNLRYPAVKGCIKADYLSESRVVLGYCINVFDLSG
jgi:hypothetical protein